MASVAFLEALINEVYADASDRDSDSTRIAALGAATQTSMQHYIGSATRKPTTLEKYDEVIRLAGATPLDHSRAPYQHARTLTSVFHEVG